MCFPKAEHLRWTICPSSGLHRENGLIYNLLDLSAARLCFTISSDSLKFGNRMFALSKPWWAAENVVKGIAIWCGIWIWRISALASFVLSYEILRITLYPPSCSMLYTHQTLPNPLWNGLHGYIQKVFQFVNDRATILSREAPKRVRAADRQIDIILWCSWILIPVRLVLNYISLNRCIFNEVLKTWESDRALLYQAHKAQKS